MARLALIRHAPTEWSAARRFQGRADPPLSADGRGTVAGWSFPAEFAGWAWVTSPLRRCRETLELLRPGRPYAVEPRLIEMDFGTWEGMTLAEVRARSAADAAEREARGLDFCAPGGETPRAVQERLRPWLATLDGNTAAVTHKGVIRALYALASGWPMLGKPPVRLRDGCLHLFRIAASGSLEVDRLNVPLLRSDRNEPAA